MALQARSDSPPPPANPPMTATALHPHLSLSPKGLGLGPQSSPARIAQGQGLGHLSGGTASGQGLGSPDLVKNTDTTASPPQAPSSSSYHNHASHLSPSNGMTVNGHGQVGNTTPSHSHNHGLNVINNGLHGSGGIYGNINGNVNANFNGNSNANINGNSNGNINGNSNGNMDNYPAGVGGYFSPSSSQPQLLLSSSHGGGQGQGGSYVGQGGSSPGKPSHVHSPHASQTNGGQGLSPGNHNSSSNHSNVANTGDMLVHTYTHTHYQYTSCQSVNTHFINNKQHLDTQSNNTHPLNTHTLSTHNTLSIHNLSI